MSTEVPEVGPSPERRPGRPGRTESGAPVSGALTIVLAVIAVVAGFLILRAITNDGDGDAGVPSGPGATTTVATDGDDDPSATSTTEPAPTTTTEPPLVTEGAVVVVANANNVDRSAGAMTELLGEAGFSMGSATNASTGQLETTAIYFDPANENAQTVAESVNRVLGGDSPISQVGTPAQTQSGELDGDVLVLLGNDKAGRSLEELAPAAADEGGATVTAPEVTGENGDDGETDPGTTDPEG